MAADCFVKRDVSRFVSLRPRATPARSLGLLRPLNLRALRANRRERRPHGGWWVNPHWDESNRGRIVFFRRAFSTREWRGFQGLYPSYGSAVGRERSTLCIRNARLISPVGFLRSGRGQGERSMRSMRFLPLTVPRLVRKPARGAGAWDFETSRKSRTADSGDDKAFAAGLVGSVHSFP